MKIHLIRHAEAVDRTADISEEDRWLTPRGRSRFREIATTLSESSVDPDLIVSSPLARAVQTADILAERLHFEGDLILSSEAGPGFGVQRLRALLERHRNAKEIAFVGHEPDLGGVAAALLGVAHCTLSKGMTVSFRISNGGSGRAEFLQMVTGGGKLVKSRDQAVERLTRSE